METANNKPNNINIIILDSCNNDPFSGSWNRSFNIQGLAPIQTTRSGSLIAYATQPGKTVDDSGLFTVRILEKIEQPGLDVLDLFRQVGQEIAEGTGSEQVPAITLSSLPDFSFNPSGAVPPPPPTERLIASQFYNRGDDKREQGDYQGAIEDYNQAIKLDPDYAIPYHNRGLARYNLKDYEEAISKRSAPRCADYNQAIRLKPDFPLAYKNRGNARLELEDYEGAMADYNQAIRLDPDFPHPYNNRGVIRARLEDYEGAMAHYNQAIRLDPDFAIAYTNRGNARRKLEDYEGAIADYNQAIRLDPDFANTYNSRGAARYKLEDYEGAIADLNQAIRLDPDFAHAYYNRGRMYKIQGKREGARADFLKAADLSQKQGDMEMYEKALNQLIILK